MRRFLEMSWMDFKGHRAEFNLEEFLLLDTLYPFVTMAFYVVMASYAYQTKDVTDWVVGNAFLLCVNICIFSLGAGFMGERRTGRIRSVIASPLSKIVIVLQKGFISCLVSILTTMVGLLVGCIVFHVSFEGVSIMGIIGVLLVAMFAATGLGVFLSSLGLITDSMHLVLNTVNYILLLFTGSNFPISQLPPVTRVFSKCLPLTHSIAAARRVMHGASLLDEVILQLLLREAVVGLLYFAVAAIVVRYAEKRAIIKGTYDLF